MVLLFQVSLERFVIERAAKSLRAAGDAEQSVARNDLPQPRAVLDHIFARLHQLEHQLVRGVAHLLENLVRFQVECINVLGRDQFGQILEELDDSLLLQALLHSERPILVTPKSFWRRGMTYSLMVMFLVAGA